MGANALSTQGFNPDNNINLSATYDKTTGKKVADGLTSNLDNWPNDGRYETVNGVKGKSWWHSDYKDLAYQFTYEFYKKIVKETK